MAETQFPIGQRITLPGHFAEPVALESVRPLGDGCECRVRLPDSTLLNADEFALYKAVTRYINHFIRQQQGQRKTSAALARTVLQRRLASSACAIHKLT